MATLTLPEVFDLRLKIKELEGKINSGELSLFERCDLEDEVLELKEKLGEFDRLKFSDEGECLNCSA
ncbi:hypothetical protein DYBT9623_05524 [Dyadobacter sp. CECT 9623]|jgi:hypothetical protein|uniref:Uncharacterized protein n=1 Tax=Dyadobacter linearis TaxID=2823330 RepID=A0ABN7RJX3_9BACT|nr:MULTISPECIES: hypothetical protein [unclassified Dyadobacter]MCE7063628.1 hypothetical protein [Dyadobacter sp. CY343]CAG5074888.1 hypothetical protein DYBT9623_05524 [Dyadobacter sp. CECT 9623]